MSLPSTAAPYAPFFQQASQQYGVPVEILAAVAQQESSMGTNPKIYMPGPAGELGIMQTTPGIVQQYGIADPLDPQSDINGAAQYLAVLYNKTGNWPSAVAAYNGTGSQAQAYSNAVMKTANSYGYGGGMAGVGSAIGNVAQTVLQGAGLQPFSSTALGTNPGVTAGQNISQWFSKNWPVVVGLGAAGVIGIMAIATAFSTGGGGSKTTIMPVPV